ATHERFRVAGARCTGGSPWIRADDERTQGQSSNRSLALGPALRPWVRAQPPRRTRRHSMFPMHSARRRCTASAAAAGLLTAVTAIALIIFGAAARASAFQLSDNFDPARATLLFSFPSAMFANHGKGNGHGDGDGDNDDNGHKPGVVVPPPPCHPNPTAAQDIETVAHRGDVVHLPDPLRARLIELAGRPHSVLPVQARAEADKPSQLFQYYLLD